MKKNILLVLLILLGVNPLCGMKRKRPVDDDSGEERKRRKVEDDSQDPGFILLQELLGLDGPKKRKKEQEGDKQYGRHRQADGRFYCHDCEESFEIANFLQKHIEEVHEKPEVGERVEFDEQSFLPNDGFFKIRDVATSQLLEKQFPLHISTPKIIERKGAFSFTRLSSLSEEGEDAILYALFAMVCLIDDDSDEKMRCNKKLCNKKLFNFLKNRWEKGKASGEVSSMEDLMAKDPFFESLINKDGNPAENVSLIDDLDACEQALQTALVDEYEIGSDQVDQSEFQAGIPVDIAKLKFVKSHFIWKNRREVLQNICRFRNGLEIQIISFRMVHGTFVCKLFSKNGMDHILMLSPNDMMSDDVLKSLAKRVYFLFRVDPIPGYVLTDLASPLEKKKGDSSSVVKRKRRYRRYKEHYSDYLGDDGVYRCPSPCNFKTKTKRTFGKHLVNKAHGHIKIGDRPWDIYLDSEKKLFICPVCDKEYRVDQYSAFTIHVQKNHRGFKRGYNAEKYEKYRAENSVKKPRRTHQRSKGNYPEYRGEDGLYHCPAPCNFETRNIKTFGGHLVKKAHGHIKIGDRPWDIYLDSEKKLFICPVCDEKYRVDQYSSFRSHVKKKHRGFKRGDDPEKYRVEHPVVKRMCKRMPWVHLRKLS